MDRIICGFEIEDINYDTVTKRDCILSVFVPVYNYYHTLAQCLDSILNQKTDFNYEIVIIDDASTDGSTDIVKEYCEKYPSIIRALVAKINTYRDPRRHDLDDEMCKVYGRGKYQAIVEGDDYWIDENKLQTQISFLENHPDYSLIIHDAFRIDMRDGKKEIMNSIESDCTISTEDIILQKKGMFPTGSMLGKREGFIGKENFTYSGIGDWPMQLYSAAIGKVYYINKPMSVYRFMASGSWSESTLMDINHDLTHLAKMIRLLLEYNRLTDNKYSKAINERAGRFFSEIYYKYIDFSFSEFEQACYKAIDSLSEDLAIHIRFLIGFYRIRRDDSYVDDLLASFIESFENIYIMGAGDFGRKVANKFVNNGIDFEGFLVSKCDKPYTLDEYHKLVYSVTDCNVKKENTSVVVAIDCVELAAWETISDTLENNGLIHYFSPILFPLNYVEDN